jgi:hypothetical protein
MVACCDDAGSGSGEAHVTEATDIGPVATHLLLENDDVKVWQMNTPPGGTFWRHYHNHDYVLFYTTDVLATVYDAPEDHERIWNARYAGGAAAVPGIMTYANSVFFIPGTGFLSPGFVNLGDTPFIAPLVEVLRPRRADQRDVGFARSDALVGAEPRAGRVHLLETDRVRVFLTTVPAGAVTDLSSQADGAVYVIDGGTPAADGAGAAVHADHTAHWRAAGEGADLRNCGTTTYREVCVELK